MKKENNMYKSKEIVMKTLMQIGYDKPFKVTFAKVNGEIREMKAMMPTPDEPKSDVPENMPVWDTEKEAWRSFNLNRVVELN
jgi:hypothetical protein